MLNGQILVPALSFAFYNIKDGDFINVIPKPPETPPDTQKTQNQKHNRFTSPSLYQVKAVSLQMYELYGKKPDSDGITDIINQLSDLDYGAEVCRLRDQIYAKIDGNVSSYRKLVKRYQILNQCSFSKPMKFPSLSFSSSEQPSTQSLPLFWKSSV